MDSDSMMDTTEGNERKYALMTFNTSPELERYSVTLYISNHKQDELPIISDSSPLKKYDIKSTNLMRYLYPSEFKYEFMSFAIFTFTYFLCHYHYLLIWNLELNEDEIQEKIRYGVNFYVFFPKDKLVQDMTVNLKKENNFIKKLVFDSLPLKWAFKMTNEKQGPSSRITINNFVDFCSQRVFDPKLKVARRDVSFINTIMGLEPPMIQWFMNEYFRILENLDMDLCEEELNILKSFCPDETVFRNLAWVDEEEEKMRLLQLRTQNLDIRSNL